MKEIILKKIQLSNFKSLNLEVTFSEGVTRISGRNGIGKTSIASAFYWLLSSYTSPTVPKNFALFDDRVELSHETPLAKVKAWLHIDGYDYTIEKTAEAKFTRAKGSSVWTKAASDTYTMYIDEIETSSTAFNEWINANICQIDMLPYALSGEFFAFLVLENKNKARSVLTSLVGEIKETDFKGDYSSISEAMSRYSANELVELCKKKKKPLEERQNAIPDEIDFKESRLSELKAMDFYSMENEIERVKSKIEVIDKTLLGNADAIKPVLDHNREIENKVANLRLSMSNGRLAHVERQNERTGEIKAKLAEIRRHNENVDGENAKTKRKYDEEVKNVELAKKRISLLEEKREELLKRRDEVKARVYREETCAYCGQELPVEMLEKAKEKFSETKRRDLELIVKEGRAVAEEIKEKKESLKTLEEEVAKGYTLLEKQSTDELEETLARVESTLIPYENTPEYDELQGKITTLEGEIKEIPSNDNEGLTKQKKGLIDELSALSMKLGLKDEINVIEKAIVELKDELRNVAYSIATLEGQIFKCEEWLQERNEIVSSRVNGKLEHSKIEMFSTQKNGDVVPDCVLCNTKGVKYGTTNGADRATIGIDLQRLFLRHFDVTLPIWVDEASVFDSKKLPLPQGNQMIYLFASDSETLEVETN